MSDRIRLLETIELAIHDHPYCPTCGTPTVIRETGGRIWLECASFGQERGLVARLGAAVAPHLRRVVVDLRADLAA